MTIQAIDVYLKEIHGQVGTFYRNCVPINPNNWCKQDNQINNYLSYSYPFVYETWNAYGIGQ